MVLQPVLLILVINWVSFMKMYILLEEYKEYSKEYYKHRTNVSRFSLINKYIMPYFGNCDIELIGTSILKDFFDLLKNTKLSDNSIFGIYACMLSIFKFSKMMGYIEESPMDEEIRCDRSN